MPGLKRFISPDTIVPGTMNPQAFNRYTYVLNNPLKFVDPTGHSAEICGDDLECWRFEAMKVLDGNLSGGDSPGGYHGYFENAYGEQAVFVYDRQAGTGSLWMGDLGWEKPVSVIDGELQGLILGEVESTWLEACWQAAVGRPRRDV